MNPPNDDTSQQEQPAMVENQLPDGASPIQPTTSANEQLEEPSNTTSDDQDNTSDRDGSAESIRDRTISYKIIRSKRHQHAAQSEPLYRIRWYDYGPSDDSWEPTADLPRSKIVSY